MQLFLTEATSQIVSKHSATLGLPGHREVVIGLDADHRKICKFDLDTELDADIYQTFVEPNFQWLQREMTSGPTANDTAIETPLGPAWLQENENKSKRLKYNHNVPTSLPHLTIPRLCLPGITAPILAHPPMFSY